MFNGINAMITPRFWRQTEDFNRVIDRCKDAGLVEKWLREPMAAEALAPPKKAKEPPKPLTMTHVLGPTLLWIMLLAALGLLFLAEVVVGAK